MRNAVAVAHNNNTLWQVEAVMCVSDLVFVYASMLFMHIHICAAYDFVYMWLIRYIQFLSRIPFNFLKNERNTAERKFPMESQ